MNTDFYINLKDDRESIGSCIRYFKEKVDFIIDESKSKNKILDIGCESGFIGELLVRNNNDVYGVDIVKKKLKIARKRGVKVKLCDVENQDLPFKDNFFDIVVLGDIIEHVFDTDKLLEKAKRVLKREGKLLISTPNVASFGRRIMLLIGINPFLEYSSTMSINNFPPVGHIRYYTVKNLKEQLLAHGFNKITIKGDA